MKAVECAAKKVGRAHFAHVIVSGLTYCEGTIGMPWWWTHAAENNGHRTQDHIETGQECLTCGARGPESELEV
jgi:hypothetical protein